MSLSVRKITNLIDTGKSKLAESESGAYKLNIEGKKYTIQIGTNGLAISASRDNPKDNAFDRVKTAIANFLGTSNNARIFKVINGMIKKNSLLDKHFIKNKGAFEKQNLEFKKELFNFMNKNGIHMPYSMHPRQYPPISDSDTMRVFKYKITDDKVTYLTNIYNKYNITIKIPEDCGDNRQKIEYLLERSGLVDLDNLSLDGAHGYGLSYPDEYIKNVHQGKSKTTGEYEYIDIKGRCVLLQQATRGCTAAVSAMLIHDLGGIKMDQKDIATRNLGKTEDILDDLRTHSIEPKCSTPLSLIELEYALKNNGPGIVSVDSGIGGHVVIVDEVNLKENYVTIRDPAHGWMIDVNAEYFFTTCDNNHQLIQGKKNVMPPLQDPK